MANDWEGVEEIDAAAFLADRSEASGKAPRQRVRITNLTPELIDAFVASPRLKHVTHLDLSGNRIGHGGAYGLFFGGQLGEVTHLDLSGNRILNTIEELTFSKVRVQDLQELRLANNGIDSGAGWPMQYLARLPFDQLRYLDLRGNRIDRDDMKDLAESEHFQPDMTIAVDGFQGRFAEFQQWARGKRRGGGKARHS